jgi:hypothetical protein
MSTEKKRRLVRRAAVFFESLFLVFVVVAIVFIGLDHDDIALGLFGPALVALYGAIHFNNMRTKL